MSNFYMIPLASLPANPSYPVWFATWSTDQPVVTWSSERPGVKADDVSIWVVGVIAGEQCQPQGCVVLAGGGKDLPPPPLELPAGLVSLDGFKQAFAHWATNRGDE